jgi:hypothetical protein
MKNKKNKILLVLALVLGGATYWYFQYKRDNNLNGYDFEFAVKDTAAIHKIFLADRKGRKITLTRNGADWQLNGAYKARKDAIDNLLSTIARVELMYRLPRNAVENVVKDIASEGHKVEIYDKNNKQLKAYYVGGSDADGYGTHMMLEGSNEPYVTHIPSFVGNLRVRYFTELLDWRDRYIFPSITPDDIQLVSIDYPLQKSKSFKLERAEKNFKIEPLYPITPKITRPMTKGLVESYLFGFKKLGIEGFENGHPQTDSIKTALPFAIVTLNTIKGEQRVLKFHPIVPTNGGGAVLVSYDGKTVVERYYLEDSNGDLDMVQHLIFERIFWAYESFFTRPRG